MEYHATSGTLHLHWRADSAVSRPYYLSLVPVPPDKSYREGIIWKPGGWKEDSYPPSWWLLGQVFVDTITVPLGANPQPDNWLFSLAISDVYTREVMMNIVGQTSTQIGIGPVNVPATQ